MNTVDPDNETLAVVDRIIQRKKPKKVILFGSRGRGTSGPDSDIDLCVLYENMGAHNLETTQSLYEAIFDVMHAPVDLVVYDEEIFRERCEHINSFEALIAQEGHVMYG